PARPPPQRPHTGGGSYDPPPPARLPSPAPSPTATPAAPHRSQSPQPPGMPTPTPQSSDTEERLTEDTKPPKPTPGVVPSLATGWSHARGRKPLRVVP